MWSTDGMIPEGGGAGGSWSNQRKACIYGVKFSFLI